MSFDLTPMASPCRGMSSSRDLLESPVAQNPFFARKTFLNFADLHCAAPCDKGPFIARCQPAPAALPSTIETANARGVGATSFRGALRASDDVVVSQLTAYLASHAGHKETIATALSRAFAEGTIERCHERFPHSPLPIRISAILECDMILLGHYCPQAFDSLMAAAFTLTSAAEASVAPSSFSPAVSLTNRLLSRAVKSLCEAELLSMAPQHTAAARSDNRSPSFLAEFLPADILAGLVGFPPESMSVAVLAIPAMIPRALLTMPAPPSSAPLLRQQWCQIEATISALSFATRGASSVDISFVELNSVVIHCDGLWKDDRSVTSQWARPLAADVRAIASSAKHRCGYVGCRVRLLGYLTTMHAFHSANQHTPPQWCAGGSLTDLGASAPIFIASSLASPSFVPATAIPTFYFSEFGSECSSFHESLVVWKGISDAMHTAPLEEESLHHLPADVLVLLGLVSVSAAIPEGSLHITVFSSRHMAQQIVSLFHEADGGNCPSRSHSVARITPNVKNIFPSLVIEKTKAAPPAPPIVEVLRGGALNDALGKVVVFSDLATSVASANVALIAKLQREQFFSLQRENGSSADVISNFASVAFWSSSSAQKFFKCAESNESSAAKYVSRCDICCEVTDCPLDAQIEWLQSRLDGGASSVSKSSRDQSWNTFRRLLEFDVRECVTTPQLSSSTGRLLEIYFQKMKVHLGEIVDTSLMSNLIRLTCAHAVMRTVWLAPTPFLHAIFSASVVAHPIDALVAISLADAQLCLRGGHAILDMNLISRSLSGSFATVEAENDYFGNLLAEAKELFEV